MLSGAPYLVIGVVPDGLGYPEDHDLWIPAPPDVQKASRHAGFLKIVARRKPDATLPGLQAQLSAVTRRLAAQYPDTDAGRSARPVPLRDDQNAGSRLPLLVLLGTVAMVLLIACVNIAGLLLARAAERQRESAIRTALGAGRGGLVRLYLVESLLLALAGARRSAAGGAEGGASRRYPAAGRGAPRSARLRFRPRAVAALWACLPFEGGSQSGPIAIEGRTLAPALAVKEVSHRAISEGYFRAMDIPLRSGRFLRDAGNGRKEALINEALAKAYFPAGGALGRRITFDVKPGKGEAPVWFEIAGVVGDVRLAADQADPMPEVFVLTRDTYWPMARLVLRARAEPGALAPAVRQAVHRLDPNLVVDEIATLDSQVDLATADSRVRVRLLGGFALLALWLAVFGLYGVLSGDVARRTHEIGVRLTLGADPGRVARGVLGQGLAIVLGGLLLGLCAAAALGRWLGALLFGVRPLDLPVLVAVSVAMIVVAAAASYLPASRAAEVDPGVALRHE